MQWLAGLALMIVVSQTGAGTGRVTGVVTDTAGGLIPGATITLRSGTSERATVTDARGAFAFDDVPRGRYAVIASLQGFYGQPHTGIAVTPGATVSLKLQLETDCLAVVDYVDMGLAWVLKEADVIAHIRIAAAHRPIACSVAEVCTCTLHQAGVVRVLKGQPARQLRLLQHDAGYTGSEQPYAPGDEFIAFLKRDDTNHAFGPVAGPTYMFRVRNGRVVVPVPAPAGFKNGMTVAEFENALRAVR